MIDLVLLVAEPTSALPADWALYIIGGLVATGGTVGVAFWKMHRQAMGKFDSLINETSKLSIIEQHIKESKFAEQKTHEDLLEVNSNLKVINTKIDHNTETLSRLNSRVNSLAKKMKCTEPVS